MRMTRGIVLICTLTLAVSLLGGCNGNSDSSASNGTAATTIKSFTRWLICFASSYIKERFL